MEAAESELSARKGAPAGILRLTTTADIGHILLWPIVKGYLKKYPSMNVEMVLTNRFLDLVQENIDLAIRIGNMKDSTMIGRGFLESPGHLWAHPNYLKKSSPIRHPRDLEAHNCISFSRYISQTILLEKKDEKIEVPFPGRINVDDMQTVKSFVLQGEGIGAIPEFLCREEAESGKLVKILPQWTSFPTKLSFVYPAQRFVSPKVQSFIEYALESYFPKTAKA
jgi:DNA-binding transcriptional LysR family regulator